MINRIELFKSGHSKYEVLDRFDELVGYISGSLSANDIRFLKLELEEAGYQVQGLINRENDISFGEFFDYEIQHNELGTAKSVTAGNSITQVVTDYKARRYALEGEIVSDATLIEELTDGYLITAYQDHPLYDTRLYYIIEPDY